MKKLIKFHEDAALRMVYLDEAGLVGPPYMLNDCWGTGLSAAALLIIINKVGKTYIPLYSFMGRWGRDIIFFCFMCVFIKAVADIAVRATVLAHPQYTMTFHCGPRWILGAALRNTLFVGTIVKQESMKTKSQLIGVA